ncbi:hypothetical protein SASPL_142016 [Salvia splendens]|uniref:Glycine cleavage system H protein n=1 Tax=Salvia splendens TaxID=180675 RepID=A0A8X8WKM1_SALSN|nr:hypothetical protein SASPL_142016 [Salvia splendens]
MATSLWPTRAASYLRINVPCRGFATGSDLPICGLVIEELGLIRAAVWLIEISQGSKVCDSHEWVIVEGKSATVRPTSVKATSYVKSPVSGKVVEVNKKLSDSPGLVNSSPYEDGWIIKVELEDDSDDPCLMDPGRYTKFCEEEDASH